MEKNVKNPFTADIEGTIAAELIEDGVSAEDALILNSVITPTGGRKGYMRLYHPVLQKVLFKLLKAPLIAALKEWDKKNEEKNKEMKAQLVKNAAEVAKAMVDDSEDE